MRRSRAGTPGGDPGRLEHPDVSGGSGPSAQVDAQRLLDDLIAREERLVTDVEVLQEILHWYSAIDRADAIQPAFDAVLNLVDDVLPINLKDVEQAKRIVLGSYGLSARDALHVSVMQAHEIRRIASFDAQFDRFPGIERLA